MTADDLEQSLVELGRLSVVIPALNEEDGIAAAVQSAYGSAAEVVVVDGGSTDGTARVAAKLGAQVVSSGRGRAVQMNAGWRRATGDYLLFLHADSQLPEGYHSLIQQAMQLQQQRHGMTPRWGCFESIDIERPRWAAWLLRGGVRLRTRCLHLPYGDQGIFVEQQLMRELAGYKVMPLLEDVDLVKRLRRIGRPAIVPQPMRTSGRRWQELGFVRTMLINQCILCAWRLGVSPDTLAGWYYRKKAS